MKPTKKRGRPMKTTPEIRNEIRETWAARPTIKGLCKKYGLGRFTVRGIIATKERSKPSKPAPTFKTDHDLMLAINEADRKNGRRLSFPKIAA